jgi:hypothetical protein
VENNHTNQARSSTFPAYSVAAAAVTITNASGFISTLQHLRGPANAKAT